MKTKIRHTSIQNNLYHYTKLLTMHLLNKTLTILIKSRDINSKSKKSIVTLRDSMLKHVNGWEMSEKVKSDCKIFVKHFSGSTTNCLDDYMKPSLRKDLIHTMLHVGTNDLILNGTSQDIATSIVNLACSMKDKNCDISISNIILRTDNKKFNQKGQEVNTHLKDMCNDKNIYLIDNTNKIKAQNLYKSKFHLNKRSLNVLSSNFVNELSRILIWQRDKNNTGVEEFNSDETNVNQKLTDGNRC